MSVTEEIRRLKKEKNAVLLAHYYVPDEVQEIADFIGDSYYLSKKAAQTQADILVFCGVRFMGESAAILNPGKKVLMPDLSADCAMAHMAEVERIKEMRERYEDLAVVCYINSTAEIKTYSDVCVTSANAVKIVKALPNRNIYFIPDGNLGRYVAEQVPEKHVLLGGGYCPVHAAWTAEDAARAKAEYPGAKFLVHPECTKELLEQADYIGSTSGIIEFAAGDDSREYIIGTEEGVLYELKKQNPDKVFYTLNERQICGDMKLVTLEKIQAVLEHETNEITVTQEMRQQALAPLKRMLELAK
ncbi:MAG: quinolinate synthase NadA [Lachnospiraceae bacterium]|uniref:quinolinate synthase NadA n=1 Tax=Parablautia sp. Marseille-Q6255 TaxID=3039593 RepID=UPI0024BD0656|nr:quinolinate synthase NadA [Parablautia sp. Marseille-Q6255]